jgi:hypothetical protein
MSEAEAKQLREQQRRDQYHGQNLAGGENTGETAEILHELSEIDDLPIQPQDDEIMGQLISKLTSTANLSAEEVRSNEWVREYILLLYLCLRPKETGCHGDWRAWSHGDQSEAIPPLDTQTRLEMESLVTSSKLALSRSEDFTAATEAVRTVRESIVNDGDESSGGGGLLAKVGLR